MKSERYIETCTVADQECIAAANFAPLVRARGECFECGGAVCSKCSSKRTYRGVLRRLCNNCQERLDGNRRRVIARLYGLLYGRREGARLFQRDHPKLETPE